METTLPTDCGNAPRVTIVSEFVRDWAAGDTASITPWLTDHTLWTLAGEPAHHGVESASEVCPDVTPDRLVIRSVVTHGRLAACDGYFHNGTQRTEFCHMFRFAGAAKTSTVAEIRTFVCSDGEGRR